MRINLRDILNEKVNQEIYDYVKQKYEGKLIKVLVKFVDNTERTVRALIISFNWNGRGGITITYRGDQTQVLTSLIKHKMESYFNITEVEVFWVGRITSKEADV
jgi:PDZ domain-containing secreted protein